MWDYPKSNAPWCLFCSSHYDDVIMGEIASQITSLTIVYSAVYLDADQRKHQSSATLAFVRRIHRGPVNTQHKWPVTRKMFPFDDVIMKSLINPWLYIYKTDWWTSPVLLCWYIEVISSRGLRWCQFYWLDQPAWLQSGQRSSYLWGVIIFATRFIVEV